jgi:hypothetical protein
MVTQFSLPFPTLLRPFSARSAQTPMHRPEWPLADSRHYPVMPLRARWVASADGLHMQWTTAGNQDALGPSAGGAF